MASRLRFVWLPGVMALVIAPPPATSEVTPLPDFDARADQVVLAWRSSGMMAGWRRGLMPLEPLVRFHSGGQRGAFNSTRLIGTPPTRPGVAIAVGADGARLQVPTLNALGAISRARHGSAGVCPPDAPRCGTLAVTGAVLATARIRTNRGLTRVPAWHIRIAASRFPIVIVAIAPSALRRIPDRVPGVPSYPVGQPTTVRVSPNTRTLGFTVGIGCLSGPVTPALREEADMVVIGAREAPAQPLPPGAVCTMEERLKPVSVTLTRPLGARPVVDASTGRPLELE